MTTRTLVSGRAKGRPLLLDEPLSFWGGVEGATGIINDQTHPQYGESVASRIVVMPHGRGSSSSSSVLAELLRLGVGPAAIVLDEADSILVIGSLVAATLYGAECPVVIADELPDDRGIWWIDASDLSVEIRAQSADNQ